MVVVLLLLLACGSDDPDWRLWLAATLGREVGANEQFGCGAAGYGAVDAARVCGSV